MYEHKGELSMSELSLLQPLIALVLWSFVIWTWMYATRIPAIMKMKMRMDPEAPRGEQMALLPAKVRWKADNYNHLMEQPTLFYAVTLALAIVGDASPISTCVFVMSLNVLNGAL